MQRIGTSDAITQQVHRVAEPVRKKDTKSPINLAANPESLAIFLFNMVQESASTVESVAAVTEAEGGRESRNESSPTISPF